MNNSPALDEKQRKHRQDSVELCGKNRGPHDYIPIEWKQSFDEESKKTTRQVTHMICRVCFSHVNVGMLVNSYREVKL